MVSLFSCPTGTATGYTSGGALIQSNNKIIGDKVQEKVNRINAILADVLMTPGTATTYNSFGQYMPRQQSTLGELNDQLENIVTAPINAELVNGLYHVAKHPSTAWRMGKLAGKLFYDLFLDIKWNKHPSYKLYKYVENTKLPVVVQHNVGWAPKQSIEVVHASNSAEPLLVFYPQRWDVINEGANPFGIWYQGKLGTPRTAMTNGVIKGNKAQKARDLFASRPFQGKGILTLDKPIQTIGDVPNRSALSYLAEQLGADGIIYNGIYDNGYNNNLVILSQKVAKQ